MGLDVGDNRIGVAMSDPLGYSAHPLVTLNRATMNDDVYEIAQLIREYGVAEIVIGNPVDMSGRRSRQAVQSRALAQRLAAYISTKKPPILPIPILHLWNERLSSSLSRGHVDDIGSLHEQGGAVGRRVIANEVAAVLILQAFIDARPRIGF
jgi:putative holliday junction resolvase